MSEVVQNFYGPIDPEGQGRQAAKALKDALPIEHPTTKHGCEPRRFTFDSTSPAAALATLHLEGVSFLDAVSASIEFDVNDFVRVKVRYADGAEDIYEAHDVAISIVGWPVCPTGEH